MHNDETATYYTVTKKYHLNFPQLENDIDVDVVIIGGGFSGIHTAMELAEQGVTSVAVLEARYLGFGGSGRNGGQVMAGIGHDLDAIKKDVGEEGIKAVLALSELGPQIMRERIQRYQIDADFHSGYTYLGFNRRQSATLREWEKLFNSLGGQDEIRYVEGDDLKKLIGSDAYHSGLLHMGGGHVHSLNLLLGEAKAISEIYGVKIFEHSPALEVVYGKKIHVRTAKGTITANKLVWACDSFMNKLEPELNNSVINTYAFQLMTEPLSDELIHRISPIRGAYSDIRPIIDYYRVTKENRLLFGSATPLLEYIPKDMKAWNRKLMLNIFPYLEDVKIDLAWGGPMASTTNLFPQIGTLTDKPNAFFVQGYCGFGVTPSQIICKILAEGILGGSERYTLLSRIPRRTIPGKDHFRTLLCTLGKVAHQTAGYWQGRR
ncbi:NAD(P)/FAD-dependent oxidoreductase [Pectobacterium zantedeschiae]|uniref:FAD-binding oxidoreductase n=1 Tax=Pectobacterium zantedeschiae TaxID=2034769 RepID=A0A9X8JLG2_9GAMM|nr:FAD-binding oxidoreductase [Pectobacterium zantedeschiae]RYC38328.1 FAD-dependent oxidoreductase [Pectobacterium zantedeschiae]RYC44973.1 FAD-binding oxidoreductase [Pectobacterium zantedeschiae]